VRSIAAKVARNLARIAGLFGFTPTDRPAGLDSIAALRLEAGFIGRF
jgi:hypothetical protein